MKNKVLKEIIKQLANAPTLAAQKAIENLKTPEDKEEARRIFQALNITPISENPAKK
jgi:hypothetical protein